MLHSPHRSNRQGGPLFTSRPGWGSLGLALLSTLPLALGTNLAPAAAQQSGYGQTMGNSPAENQIYNYDPANGSRTGSGSEGLNPANPLDLFNKIRKGTAMEEATPPGDAVDQALKELEAQSRPQPAAKQTGPVVASPQRAPGAAAMP
ncbi:MAG: hypothetical protein VKM17_04850 [Cyanobacteriota bacterium]|nr:hypothetical protein [Cyanobacteriota bacterium]